MAVSPPPTLRIPHPHPHATPSRFLISDFSHTAESTRLHPPLAPSSVAWLDTYLYVQWVVLLLACLCAMFLLVHSISFHRLKRRMADFILCIIGLSDLSFVALEALKQHVRLTYGGAYDKTQRRTPFDPDDAVALLTTSLARFAFFMSLYWITNLSLLMRVGRVESLHVRRSFVISVVLASVYGVVFATLPVLTTSTTAHTLHALLVLLLQLTMLGAILVNMHVVRKTRMSDNTHGRNVIRRLTGYVVCAVVFTLPFAVAQLCFVDYVAFGVITETLTYLLPITNAFLFGTSLACFCAPSSSSSSSLPSPSSSLSPSASHAELLMDVTGDTNLYNNSVVDALTEMTTTGPVVKIGEGSSAIVYRTQWLGITVAMKCIRLQGVTEGMEDLYLTHMSEIQATFCDEATLAAQLRHPNITLFIKLGMYKGSMCLVNEYCARGSLRDVLKANPLLEWSTKVRLAFEAAKGLAFMHNRDPIYLHRDIKASNILVTEDWTAKIADFGISRIAPEYILTTTRRKATAYVLEMDDTLDKHTQKQKQNLQNDMRVLTSFAGTWRWNAPEIMANPNECCFNRATDVYSFGMAMWEILTNGATPFTDVSFDHQVRALVANGERPKIPPIYVSRAPAEFVAILRACWDQDASQRPTAQEVMLRLGSLSYTLLTNAEHASSSSSSRALSSRGVFSDNYYHAIDSARSSCVIVDL